MNDDFQDLMRHATRLTREGRLNEATETIQRALSGTAQTGAVSRHATSHEDVGAVILPASPPVLDGSEIKAETHTLAATPQEWRLPTRNDVDDAAEVFTSGTYTGPSRRTTQTRVAISATAETSHRSMP